MKRILRKTFWWAGSLFTALLIILVVHITIMVKRMPRLTHPTVQLARADFSEPLNGTAAMRLQQAVSVLPGVSSTYYNEKNNIFIYAFDNRKNSAQGIYDAVIKNFGCASERYTVKPEDMGKGCPVIDNNSFSGKVTRFISRIVN